MNVETRTWEGSFKKEQAPPQATPGIFLRSIAAQIIGRATETRPAAVATVRWPHDRALLDIVTRATSAPATTFTTGWAAELAHQVVADGLTALGASSAAAQLFAQGLVLTWNGEGAISVPAFTASATAASFVAEGDPIPVRQFVDSPAILSPVGLGNIAVLTRQMIESSNAERLIGDVLMRSMGLALDAALFDANPATLARPAGLRSGIATLTASNNPDAWEGITEDISALINAIAPVAGTGPYVIVANPGRAMNMFARMDEDDGGFITFIPSVGVGNAVVAVAPGALAAAFSPTPSLETNNSASLHMDSAPQPIGSVGPARSLFQTDSVAIKTMWPVSWALRDPRGVAWLTPGWK